VTQQPHPPNGKLIRNEERILEQVRHHLREAVAVGTVKELGFKFDLSGGGPRRSKIKVTVEYEFLENVDAL
jgi:hypothetical protein